MLALVNLSNLVIVHRDLAVTSHAEQFRPNVDWTPLRDGSSLQLDAAELCLLKPHRRLVDDNVDVNLETRVATAQDREFTAALAVALRSNLVGVSFRL